VTLPLTRQGVRNLDGLGPKHPPRRGLNACPPHWPEEKMENTDGGYMLVTRCRLCKQPVKGRQG
jgi:hypothetical protein